VVVGLKFLSPPSLAVKQERTGGTWGGNCLYILYITSLPLCVFFLAVTFSHIPPVVTLIWVFVYFCAASYISFSFFPVSMKG
jgi:hypothetical protein